MEPIANVEALASMKNQHSLQKEFAKKVAMNLYNYLSSFDKQTGTLPNGGTQEYFVVPTNIFEKWYKKFEEKFDKDPNFIMKTKDA